MAPEPQKTADFGSRTVPEQEKQGLVNQVFASVAGRYDQMNDLLSGGLHRLWKDDMVTWLAPPRSARPFQVLDVAGGTGDIAFRIAATGGPGTQVTVADISAEMIAEGQRRARSQSLDGICRFSVGDAQSLAFADRTFEAYTIAFGIRNVTRIEQALDEAYRVMKPGGRFMCLEFSRLDLPVLDQLYETYSRTAVPAIGHVVTGDGAAYRYLVESIERFPGPDRFAAMIEAAGFARVQFRCLTGGIVALHSAWRI